MPSKYLALGYAVTPIHVGAGRSPGAVDLPFQRDSMGYPIVYGSSFKGVLKSWLINDDSEASRNLAKCIFGSEIGTPETSMGRFLVTDLIPVLYPIASIDRGYVYITTEYLLSRAEDLIKVIGSGKKIFTDENNSAGSIDVLLSSVEYKKTVKLEGNVKSLGSLIKNVEVAYVIGNDIGIQVVESSLIRVTRNVLNNKKTSDNLWTEEYIPQGTVLLGGIIDANRKPTLCESMQGTYVTSEFEKRFKDAAVFLGGKETIGKGLIKISLEASQDGGR